MGLCQHRAHSLKEADIDAYVRLIHHGLSTFAQPYGQLLWRGGEGPKVGVARGGLCMWLNKSTTVLRLSEDQLSPNLQLFSSMCWRSGLPYELTRRDRGSCLLLLLLLLHQLTPG